MSITIRLGQASDATALAELAARTFRETFAAENRPEDMALHLAQSYGTSQQERELTDPNVALVGAQVEVVRPAPVVLTAVAHGPSPSPRG